ncbi:hypothetical protein [Streptomyces sp. NPDC005438]|uniref:hypothetical protein n=1 Tax=Streptomyces sp. NPDC005438 TaxID=3156880 RepID=UPI0033B9D431
MGADGTSRSVRLRVELVIEVADVDALTGAALERVEQDDSLPAEERERAGAVVAEDPAEALASLVDPFRLVMELPGVELARANWEGEELGDGDPEVGDPEAARAHGDSTTGV